MPPRESDCRSFPASALKRATQRRRELAQLDLAAGRRLGRWPLAVVSRATVDVPEYGRKTSSPGTFFA